jgi:hypothetical protein
MVIHPCKMQHTACRRGGRVIGHAVQLFAYSASACAKKIGAAKIVTKPRARAGQGREVRRHGQRTCRGPMKNCRPSASNASVSCCSGDAHCISAPWLLSPSMPVHAHQELMASGVAPVATLPPLCLAHASALGNQRAARWRGLSEDTPAPVLVGSPGGSRCAASRRRQRPRAKAEMAGATGTQSHVDAGASGASAPGYSRPAHIPMYHIHSCSGPSKETSTVGFVLGVRLGEHLPHSVHSCSSDVTNETGNNYFTCFFRCVVQLGLSIGGLVLVRAGVGKCLLRPPPAHLGTLHEKEPGHNTRDIGKPRTFAVFAIGSASAAISEQCEVYTVSWALGASFRARLNVHRKTSRQARMP